jgi:hypothetical protein
MAKINKFWVVTKPTRDSELNDILFHSDMKYMRNQFVGGLKANEIIGTYQYKAEAEKIAKKLLKAKRKK